MIGSSPPLAYCTIFIVMSNEVVDLHICICMRTSHSLYLCTHRLRAAAVSPWLAAPPPTQFSGCVDLFSPVCYRITRSHVTTAVFKLRASQMLLNKNRQCCESWRDAELGVRTVCAVDHTTDEDRESICCAVRHTVTLPRAVWRTIRSPHSVRVLIATTTVRRPSCDASSPFRLCCLLRSCYNASAAQRLLLAASYIFLVTLSVFYYATEATWLTTAGSCLRPVDVLCGQPMSWHDGATDTKQLRWQKSSASAKGRTCHHLCDVNPVTNSLTDSWRHYYSVNESKALCDCSIYKVHLLACLLIYLLTLLKSLIVFNVRLVFVSNFYMFSLFSICELFSYLYCANMLKDFHYFSMVILSNVFNLDLTQPVASIQYNAVFLRTLAYEGY